MQEFIRQSYDLLKKATTPYGIVASPTNTSNYQKVWARDSVICGLSGWVAGDEDISAGLKASVLTLAQQQGPNGEIPSNVGFNKNGSVSDVSYGSLVGRVDTLGWFVVGACHVLLESSSLESQLLPSIKKALNLYTCWEFNRRGLVYSPQGGNWADEYYLEGYLLYDQLMRLWATRCAEKVTGEDCGSQVLQEIIAKNFWPTRSQSENAHNPKAYLKSLEDGSPQFWKCSFKPDGYDDRFDLFANSLAFFLQIGSRDQLQTVQNYLATVRNNSENLNPAFWPVIENSDPLWNGLLTNCGPKFKNLPYHYHNGGIWPMLNCWWALALIQNDLKPKSSLIMQELSQLNANNDSQFFEYYSSHDLKGHGTPFCTWNAAMPIVVERYLNDSERGLIC